MLQYSSLNITIRSVDADDATKERKRNAKLLEQIRQEISSISHGKDRRDGNVWFAGPYAPSESMGRYGDMYIDTRIKCVYMKCINWTLICSLSGLRGTPGHRGKDGLNGKDGIDGGNCICERITR